MDLLRGDGTPNQQNNQQTPQRNQPMPQQPGFIGKVLRHWATMDAMPPKQRAFHRFKGISVGLAVFTVFGLVVTLLTGNFTLSTIPSAVLGFIVGEVFVAMLLWASYMAS